MGNLFDFPQGVLAEEQVELLHEDDAIRIERIVSTGQVSPPGFEYDQNENEWVTVLQGNAVLLVEGRRVALARGDRLWIPAHQRHRIDYTSTEPPCIWLCVFEK